MSRSWDYIVVGAGSAGCVVARRLSDDPSVRVLLIEAGGSADHFWISVPAGMAKVIGSSRFDWCYSTEPNPGLDGRPLPWPRGKALGGSSAINGMVYTRGNRRDYDHWASLGNAGWSWSEVLPFFKRAEDNEHGADEFCGAGGPQKVSDPTPPSRAVQAFVEAAVGCGITRRSDLSVAGEEGAGLLQTTIDKGVRQSTYDAFIAPVKHRGNLTVMTNAHVARVVIQDNEAVGIEIIEGDQRSILRATREVVLSAGVLNSPHLLMLSGIGEGNHLQAHGIQVQLHLPGVGQNLQDHCGVHVKARTRPGWSHNQDVHGWRKYLEGARYLATKGGYLSASATLAAAFVRSSERMPYADLEIGFRPITFSHDPSGEVTVDPYPAISANVYRVRPDSRGQVLLRSADPLQPAAFHTNFMSAESDVQATLYGLRQIRKILAADPISSAIVAELQPGSAFQSDAELIDFIRKYGKSSYHPVGTCKMGQDDMAVVDARLRVRGVGRLRVVDASIMPTPSSGNTNAATIMIGEKGVDMIRSDARSPVLA
jgi:choline dehydrogenase